MPKMQLLKKKDTNNNVDDLGFTVTQAEIDTWNTVTNHTHDYLPLSGGTLTGTVTMTGGDFIANYVAVKEATHETSEYDKIATLGNNGYIRYRSKSELITDLNVPTLNTSGKLDTSILPAIAITDTYECSTEAEMLALSAQQGDVCIRSDLNKSFILKAVPATELSNWAELRTPTDHVLSVNGKTGAVSLAATDLTDGAALIDAISTEWCI